MKVNLPSRESLTKNSKTALKRLYTGTLMIVVGIVVGFLLSEIVYKFGLPGIVMFTIIAMFVGWLVLDYNRN